MSSYPNETIRKLCERRSVRLFTNEPVSNEDREWILRSAFEAPTAGNQQLYSILEISETELKQELAEACDHQPFIASAPLVLVFAADSLRWLEGYRLAGADPRDPGPGDLMLAVCDACIAAQNAVTAAQSLGIGSCYIGDVMENCETVRSLLNLPEYTFPCAMLVFGHPEASQLTRKKPARFRKEDIVFRNRYQTGTDASVFSIKTC